MLLNTYSYTYKVRTLLSVDIECFIFRFRSLPTVYCHGNAWKRVYHHRRACLTTVRNGRE